MKKMSPPSSWKAPLHAPIAVMLGCAVMMSLTLPMVEAKSLKPKAPTPRLSFVPALLSPNNALPTEVGLLKDVPTPALDEVVTLEGVKPNQSLEQLRQAPKANIKVVTALSVQDIQKAPTLASQANAVTLLNLQSEVAETDLKHLWRATIERNAVVRFALEKIALPSERHLSHSSEFLRKTLSVLITGAALATSTVAPIGGYESMGMMTGSQVAQNYVMGRNKPLSELTPTEHIQLSYLIDELKEALVKHYHAYQQALYSLNQLQSQETLEEAQFQKLQNTPDATQKFLAIQRYYGYRENLQNAQHKAENARIQLERMAGPQAVDTLALGIRPEASLVAVHPETKTTEVAKAKGILIGAAVPIKKSSPKVLKKRLPLIEDVVLKSPPPAPPSPQASPPLLEDAKL
jgi:hypothetical protein